MKEKICGIFGGWRFSGKFKRKCKKNKARCDVVGGGIEKLNIKKRLQRVKTECEGNDYLNMYMYNKQKQNYSEECTNGK